MKILEYPAEFENYFKNARDGKEALIIAQRFVDSNPDMFYLETDGIVTKLMNKNMFKFLDGLSNRIAF